MKEDILEQLADDWLQSKGYFTRHNMKFKPRIDHADFAKSKDCVPSDIDVIGFNPRLKGVDQVIVVGCKSWQEGFNPRGVIASIHGKKQIAGRDAWKGFRELTSPKWSDAFICAVEQIAGSSKFRYLTAVTALRGDRLAWENEPSFREAMNGNPIGIVTLAEMAADVAAKLTTTVAASTFGRTLQLLKAAGVVLNHAMSPGR